MGGSQGDRTGGQQGGGEGARMPPVPPLSSPFTSAPHPGDFLPPSFPSLTQTGATALARDLQALLECPPEPPEGADDALSHTDSGSGGREPVQLGPLPRSLVEDFMRLM